MNNETIQLNPQPQNSYKQKLIWSVITSVIITALVVGFGVYAWQQNINKQVKAELQQQLATMQEQMSPSPTTVSVTASSLPKSETDDTKLYQNQELGYSFRYPSAVASVDEASQKNPQSFLGKHLVEFTYNDIVYGVTGYKTTDYTSIEQYLQDPNSAKAGVPGTANYNKTTVAGKTAYQWKAGLITTFMVGNTVFEITAYDGTVVSKNFSDNVYKTLVSSFTVTKATTSSAMQQYIVSQAHDQFDTWQCRALPGAPGYNIFLPQTGEISNQSKGLDEEFLKIKKIAYASAPKESELKEPTFELDRLPWFNFSIYSTTSQPNQDLVQFVTNIKGVLAEDNLVQGSRIVSFTKPTRSSPIYYLVEADGNYFVLTGGQDPGTRKDLIPLIAATISRNCQ